MVNLLCIIENWKALAFPKDLKAADSNSGGFFVFAGPNHKQRLFGQVSRPAPNRPIIAEPECDQRG
jgi:hypothetical protein